MPKICQNIYFILASILVLFCLVLGGCDRPETVAETSTDVDAEIVMGEIKFPEIVGVDIPGAPKLQPPMLVMGGDSPVLTEKHGLVAPALWDWNGDGKRDLLLGEFETNISEFPMGELGSTVRVYLNIGSNEAPQFSNEFEWARDTEGTIMEVPQWCCIGFTPYFYDLNNDGYLDMISGLYHPGEVTWFRGSEDGFLPGEELEQAGDPSADWNLMMAQYMENAKEGEQVEPADTFDYWVYSSAAMGDFDDDGDYDLIFGGSALKMSENIGTKQEPKFGARKLLLDIDGNPLSIGEPPIPEQVSDWPFNESPLAGDGKTSPYVVDWDRDGVLDLLVTGSYVKEGSMAIAFFRGTKVDGEHRFHPPIDLLATTDGSKALPGSGPRIYVDDWNLDGTPDLIIGASVATVNGGEFSDELSWEWEATNKVESAGKDPGLYPPREKPTKEYFLAMSEDSGGWWETEEELDEHVAMNVEYWQNTVGVLYDTGREHWLTMRHQGRVYVMFGREDSKPAPIDNQVINPSLKGHETSRREEELRILPKTAPVKLDLFVPESVEQGGQAEVSLSIEIQDGWYIYAPTGKNAEQGMKETKVSFSVPEALQQLGMVKMPPHQYKGSFEVYWGPEVTVSQEIGTEDCEPGVYEISTEVTYQTCKEDLCLPPRTLTLKEVLTIAEN
ncbi:MAG: hypothetical protein F4166_01495 [Gammaproteobacteria bacterium]|nr:hypothetical protein [Gammaproteobacteria bacterium]